MFNVLVQNEEDLYYEDGSLSLGWFEITVDGLVISLFKNKPCLVFLSLTTLVEGLMGLKDQDEFKWVGEDSGKVFYLRREKNQLIISDPQLIFKVPFQDFKTAVLQEIHRFLSWSNSLNPGLVDEGAFIDLKQVIAHSMRNL